MVKLSVLYGHPVDPAAFEKYYAETHLPLVPKINGLVRLELEKVIATPDGSALPYYRAASLYFEGLPALQAGLGSPAGQAAVSDLSNFATGGVTVMITETAA